MDSSIDQQFIEYVVKSLVGNPEAVSVERSVDEKGVLLELTVDPEDLGRVIGKRGATAQSLRTLLRALGTKNDARYNLKIVDNGVPGSHGGDDTGSRSRKPAPADDDIATPQDDQDVPTATATAADDDEEFPTTAKPDRESDAVARARAELADLDDLDV
jgi:predicted RNA-binding protein YlqC (UPF0109 family)